MQAARLAQPRYEPVHLLGEVRAVDGQDCVVWCDGREWRCRRAASCLLAPSVGDQVLISGPDPQRVYLIAVTEQADAALSRLRAPGALLIEAADVSLRAGRGLRMEAGRLELKGGEADCAIDEMRYRGKDARLTVGQVRLAGRLYELVVDKLVQLTRNALRLTDEMDQTRAGIVDVEARQSARVHGKYSVVTGEELVKVDARQIHMG